MPVFYLALKAVHIIAVVVFLGNILVGVFWKNWSDRTHNPDIILHTIEGIARADLVFTIPSVVAIVAAGVLLAVAAHIPILGTGWVLWGLGLFILSGIAFAPVARLQQDLIAVAKTGMKTPYQQRAYVALSEKWNLWGTIALVLPLIALVIMVLKPNLPAL
jgi:uncharacterized membrane protein